MSLCDRSTTSHLLTKACMSAKRRRTESFEDEMKEIIDVWLADFLEVAATRAQHGFSCVTYENDAFVELLRVLYRSTGARKTDLLLATRLAQQLQVRGFDDNTCKVAFGTCEITAQWAAELTPHIGLGPMGGIERPPEQTYPLGSHRSRKLKLMCNVCGNQGVCCVALAPCGHVVCERCAQGLVGQLCHSCQNKVFAIQALYT
eukprot:GEMP01056950.1.p1 GENE.GEMP01056950.1~~GEMP01056950.1.p1  ORF type:complete len:230 (+),score=44.59 GEMP01056950.1:83-691(+)